MRLFKNRIEPKSGLGRWDCWKWTDIILDGELYLSRLTLLRTPWFSVKLHWIHKPDPDRDLHDHPWSFTSFVLRGWYKELECRKPHMRGAAFASGTAEQWEDIFPVTERLIRWFNHKDTRSAHRITEVSPKLLTLVFTNTRSKSWGFYDEDTFKFTDHEQYAKEGKMS